MSRRPHFRFEDAYDGPVCGIDEAGRGPLAGPIVAAAVIFDRTRLKPSLTREINDSKKLTAQKREDLFGKIQECAEVYWALCSPDEIDTINILQASLFAMKKAQEGLRTRPQVALVDGNRPPKLSCPVQTIVGGDGLSLSIAAASIIAKHVRDQMMLEAANDFPHYGWVRNMGYGTKEHLKALKIHGVTVHHRRSFSPVAELLVKDNNINY